MSSSDRVTAAIERRRAEQQRAAERQARIDAALAKLEKHQRAQARKKK